MLSTWLGSLSCWSWLAFRCHLSMLFLCVIYLFGFLVWFDFCLDGICPRLPTCTLSTLSYFRNGSLVRRWGWTGLSPWISKLYVRLLVWSLSLLRWTVNRTRLWPWMGWNGWMDWFHLEMTYIFQVEFQSITAHHTQLIYFPLCQSILLFFLKKKPIYIPWRARKAKRRANTRHGENVLVYYTVERRGSFQKDKQNKEQINHETRKKIASYMMIHGHKTVSRSKLQKHVRWNEILCPRSAYRNLLPFSAKQYATCHNSLLLILYSAGEDQDGR